MKTPEQIKAWLEAQPWYEWFKENIESFRPNRNYTNKILNGGFGERTMEGRFLWSQSREGYCFWSAALREFLRWYHEENPD